MESFGEYVGTKNDPKSPFWKSVEDAPVNHSSCWGQIEESRRAA